MRKNKLLLALLLGSSLAYGAIQHGNQLIRGTLTVTGAQTLTGATGMTQANVDNLRLDGNTLSTTNSNGDFTIDLNGTGSTIFNDLTASTIPYLDADKKLKSTAVSPTTFSYVDFTSSGQTQLDAKQARSTLTTKGDLYVATGSGVVTRLGVGSNGQVLTADSAEATGIKWDTASGSGGNLALSTKTLDYTATTADNVLLFNVAAAKTLTLFTASGNAGYVLYVKKIDATTNTVTIDGHSTETIDGRLAVVLSYPGQSVTLVSDGTNWQVLEFDPAGEFVEASISYAWPVASGAWDYPVLVNLVTGKWTIHIQAVGSNGASASTWSIGVDTNSGNVSPGTHGSDYVSESGNTGYANALYMTKSINQSSASPVNYHLKVMYNSTGGTISCKIRAERKGL